MYLTVPFILAQAPAYFQEHMNKLLKDLPVTITYLDDIIVYSNTTKDHLKQVFYKLQNEKLFMKLRKCHIFTKEIQYLDQILSAIGIKLLSKKLIASHGQQRMQNRYRLSLVLWATTENLLKILLI